MDSNYSVMDTFVAANGYPTDDHDLVFLSGGGYALIAQLIEQIDMRKIVPGGDSNATVMSGVIQEFDSAKNLIFEWRSRDHFALTDPTFENLASPTLDITHCNSIDFDSDTSFLLSSRNLDEITKISRKDGHIIWRWGGKNNQFTFEGDSLLFSHQHSARRLKNGNILMFDNGTFHPTSQPTSRAVEYHLDEQAKIATKVWEYHHDPDIYSSSMGNVQQLDNGNRLIGWGSCDNVAVTEVKPDGTTALEINFDPGVYSYRAFKFATDQTSSGVAGMTAQVPNLSLSQNYPNPFTGSSTIDFRVGSRTSVELSIYDGLGRRMETIFDGTVDAGEYSAKFEARNLANGVYICKMITPSVSLSKMMILSK